MKALLISLLIALTNMGFAQVCTPDSTRQVSGIYPSGDTMDTAYVDISYNETVTIFVPSDTTVAAPIVPYPTANARIDSVKITNWDNTISLNLPRGLQAECNPSGCVFPGNSLGCIAITGTVTSIEDTGSYLISANLTYYFTITNTPLSGYNYFVSTTINPFTIEVKQALEDSTITRTENNSFSSITVYPNPSKDVFYFNTGNSSNVAQLHLQVFNAQSDEVFQLGKITNNDSSTLVWNASECASGIYFYVLRSENEIERGKLFISK